MLTKKSVLKVFSLILAMVMVFTVASNSLAYAVPFEFFDNTELLTFDDEVVLYEWNSSRDSLKITNLSTNDQYIVFKDNDSIYLKEVSGESSRVANIEKETSKVPYSINNDWIEFGPNRYDFDLEGVLAISVAAGIIALALGGPVAAVVVALESVGSLSTFDGIYAYKWGKYRFYSSSGVEGEYWSQLYQKSGKTLGPVMHWKGKR